MRTKTKGKTYVNTNDRVRKIYAQLYWGINKANIAIDKIPAIAATQFAGPSHTALNLVRQARFIGHCTTLI